MAFEIKQIKHEKVDGFCERAMEELNSFFPLGWTRYTPRIFLFRDRKEIDEFYGVKTEDWSVGWAEGGNVFLLCPENYEKESCHKYSEEVYYALLKHELAHLFTDKVANSSKVPTWLDEGIAIYLSGQNKFKNKPKGYKEFLEFYEKHGKGVYYESGFAVEFLVEKRGKGTLLDLLKRTGETNSEMSFARLFEDVYGFGLSYDNFGVV